MINTLLVEDHELYRMGLSMLLDKAEGITLVAESADGLDGIKKARELSPDVILMDIGLPNIDGIEATQRIKDFNPDVKILIFTSRDSENDVFEAFKAGADGYIMKGATPEQTISAIKSVYEGVGWIDPSIAKMVFSNLQRPSAKVVTEPEPKKSNNSYGLTERELDVLELMVEGLSNPQIADKLVITKATAKAHVHSILQKLCVSSRTQATVTAMKGFSLMFEALAGMIMATKIHFNQMKYPIMKKQDRVVAETIYRNNVDKVGETEKYEKSKMPKSGYMTVEEYENESRAQSRREISAKILDKAEMPKDENMVYIPQKKFHLVKYNDPVGSPELTLHRKLNFDRQINAQGIVAGDFSKLVFPAVYYYAQSDCTSCDLFLINLDPSLSDIEKVKKANILNKVDTPLISTDKSIDTKFVFRTLTPIDFSSDNTKLVVKEKIGYRHDGIWQTNLWVYDFNKKEAQKLPQIRDAIVNYWAQAGGVDFDEKRWDIYPLGFDANDENRVVVCAYAYTGDVPKFLGTWSIDVYGENSRLEALTGSNIPISIVGYRMEEEADVIPVSEVEFDAKHAKELAKAKEKDTKEAKKFDDKVKKVEYERKIQQMDMDTMLKIMQRQEEMKKNYQKSKDGVTGS